MNHPDSSETGEPRVSEAWVDLGGQTSEVPLTRDQEDALVSLGLGSKLLQGKVDRRQRIETKSAEDAARFSLRQQAINRAGRQLATDAVRSVTDEGLSDRELAHIKAIRIARGYDKPDAHSDIEPMTVAEVAHIGFEQGAKIELPVALPINPDQATLFDENVTEAEPQEIKFVDVEAIEKILEAMSVYKQVSHAEDNVDGIAKKHDNPGRILDAMKANADKAIREAYPYFDRLLNVWLLKQQGYDTDQIGKMRLEMINRYKVYVANTTSADRKADLQKLKESQKVL